MLTYDDDANSHTKTNEPDWRESFYCNFFDKNSDLCGVFWMGARPNVGHGETVFILADGATDIVRSIDFKAPIAGDAESRRRIGNAEFVCIEPWKHWKVSYRVDSDWLELDWQQLSDVCDWEWEDLTNSKHFQVAGKIHARGIIGGRELEFSGYGERDRAWGCRNYGPLKVSFWMVMQFPDDVAVHGFALLEADGNYRLHGYLHKDGRTRGLARLDTETVFLGPNGPPESGALRVVDDEGREVRVDSYMRKNHLRLGTAPEDGAQLGTDATSSKTLMFLTFQRFVRSDGVVGHGMIDYNCWVGNQPSAIHAKAPPLYSTLYGYGRR